jgi:hypothetical protein
VRACEWREIVGRDAAREKMFLVVARIGTSGLNGVFSSLSLESRCMCLASCFTCRVQCAKVRDAKALNISRFSFDFTDTFDLLTE